MFKTETHLHTSEVSGCAKCTAAEMVALYHASGYSTLFVSDHFQPSTLDRFGDISWEEKLDCFCIGYNNAKEAGEKYGMHILLAAELCLYESSNHYLLYGFDMDFLKNLPEIFTMSIADFYPLAKQNGILLIQAHPMRDGKCFPVPLHTDGFEVYNSNPRHENFTAETLVIAKEHGIYITGGSDAHRIEDVGGSGVLSETEICTSADYIRLLQENKLTCI